LETANLNKSGNVLLRENLAPV